MFRRSHIAVIGGGPAGTMAAAGLAAGFQVTLFDEKLAWEKPCGGGLTGKAIRRYPFLAENTRPKQIVREAVLQPPQGRPLELRLPEPVLVYSRYDLNRLLLERASEAGCEVVRDRITAMERGPCGWRLSGAAGGYTADFLVLAAGARSAFRHLTGPLPAADSGTALGYFVPGGERQFEVRFFHEFEGYAWVFPRTDHLSVGICTKPSRESAAVVKDRLHRYMDEQGISRSGAQFFAHLLPLPGVQFLRGQCVAGDGWVAAGDAAALVDPVTGEGIYYALRSGELVAECLLQGRVDEYPRRLHQECLAELEMAARLSHRFYFGRFLGGDVRTRMIQLARHSSALRAVLADLFSGAQGYRDLRARLRSIVQPVVREFAWSLVAGGSSLRRPARGEM